jgi:hypothetical protein
MNSPDEKPDHRGGVKRALQERLIRKPLKALWHLHFVPDLQIGNVQEPGKVNSPRREKGDEILD